MHAGIVYTEALKQQKVVISFPISMDINNLLIPFYCAETRIDCAFCQIRSFDELYELFTKIFYLIMDAGIVLG